MKTAAHPREHTPETRAVRIADLGLSPLYAARFAYLNIRTLGDLSDWCGPDRRIRDVLGVHRACKFEQAIEQFWLDRETEATIRAAFAADAFAQEVRG